MTRFQELTLYTAHLTLKNEKSINPEKYRLTEKQIMSMSLSGNIIQTHLQLLYSYMIDFVLDRETNFRIYAKGFIFKLIAASPVLNRKTNGV